MLHARSASIKPACAVSRDTQRHVHVRYNRRWRRYDGTYAKRGGDKPDGCATLWRTDAFRLLAEETIHFSDHALRDNVALIVVLEARQQADADTSGAGRPHRLILGNCHILFNPKRGTHVSVAGCSTHVQLPLCSATAHVR